MIPFDISLMRVEHAHLKYVTKALGGSINILDTTDTSDKDSFVKISVPMHVADAFIKDYGMTRYLKPVLTAVTYYDDQIVAMERHPLGNLGKEVTQGLFGERRWESESEKNINGRLLRNTGSGRWYIDGTVVYRFQNGKNTNLTADGKFQSVTVDAIKLVELADRENLQPADRMCIAFQSMSGKIVVSPPIWRNMESIGSKKIGSEDETDDLVSISENQFDVVDKYLAVNLGFALKAAKDLSDEFGYHVIEPLRLDELMIQLKTVNLPKVDKSVKKTFDIGMKFTHAVAWIIGMTDDVNTLESFRAIRSLLRYLTTRGIVQKTALAKNAIYQDEKSLKDVPLKTINGIREEIEANRMLVGRMT